MDDWESYDWEGLAAGNYADVNYDDWLFEQDWADVMSGKYTFDEVASGADIRSDADLLSWVGANTSPTFISGLVSKFGDQAANLLKKYLYNPDTNQFNMAGLATAAAGLYSMLSDDKPGGYNVPVPKLEAVREQVQYDDTNRRPGEAGRQYFTDIQYVPQGDAAAKEAAVASAREQAAGIAAGAPRSAPAANPWAGKMAMNWNPPAAAQAAPENQGLPQIPQAQPLGAQNMAEGGIAGLSDEGRYLRGATDGMEDQIKTDIDGEQPARLSHGEFVIPADVVSHLGNGNSEAGAKKLYEMMSKVRKARTGTAEQGKQIDPNQFMPGGLASMYAAGGSVKRFQEGGTTTSGGIPNDTSVTSTLSPWVGDYVTKSLGEAGALAAQPYQAYTGPLTAGASGLQQQAFAGASELAQTGFTPTQFTTGTFGAQQAAQYMNPYLSAALQPQLDEARRQAQISRLEDAARLTTAGAYGGGRQAIMESELNRNLMDKQNQMLTQGYATAYDKAMQQFNEEQGRGIEAQKASEASRQYSSDFGLKSLQNLADLGATERAITGEGIAADKAQFEEQRDWAYKMPQYKLNLLSGLPIGSDVASTDQDALSKIMSSTSGLASLYQTLSGLGQTTPSKT